MCNPNTSRTAIKDYHFTQRYTRIELLYIAYRLINIVHQQSTMPPKKTVAKKPAAKKPAAGAPKTTGASAATSKEADKPKEVVVEGFTMTIKELNPVINMEEPRLVSSGKYPLIMDLTGVVGTFLRHRDCNIIEVLDQTQLEPERIRKAVIGAIRFGKPLVISMMETDTFDMMVEKFNAVHAGLMDLILSKEIIKNEKYMELVTDDDGELYKKYLFDEKELNSFCLVALSSLDSIPPTVGNRMYPITVQKN